ncbi:hypothetical protein [Cyanobium sp. NIES-981]|uniref:hypothetical protein n=1 Tax=Cyanobium sp. NIES-981 TaxID=1851505 RepID=UPI0007DD578E|nr:hypothetical protein [Cyanobium sp. NIES-981]SBO42112.1 putative Iron-regulated protein FrpC [Cyanobium sp. NIES-981]
MANLSNFTFTARPDRARSLVDGWVINPGKKVSTLAGGDIVKGTSLLASLDGVLVSEGGRLITGAGKDRVLGRGGLHGVLVEQTAVIKTGGGADTIRGLVANGSFSGSITNHGLISTGGGNDILKGIRGDGVFSYGFGIENTGRISMGPGDDSILGQSPNGTGLRVLTGSIDTGDGDDTIEGTRLGPIPTIFLTPGIEIGGEVRITTGDGNDLVIGRGITGIQNSGLIRTGRGNDRVDALTGGFSGLGGTLLGAGNDTLAGFAALGFGGGVNAGTFIGGKGKDKILLDNGVYTITGEILSRPADGGSMRVRSFEKIGGINGGMFNFADGTLTVSGGVATSLV